VRHSGTRGRRNRILPTDFGATTLGRCDPFSTDARSSPRRRRCPSGSLRPSDSAALKLRRTGPRGYLPIETPRTGRANYDSFVEIPRMLDRLRAVIAETV